jgi:hypothetical protein
METKAVNNKPSKPFIIANTIYDTALVRLMENQQIAKFFISTILEQPVEEFVRIIIHQTGENCEFFLQKTVFRPIVIAGSAATKQSGKSCISGLLRRYAPAMTTRPGLLRRISNSQNYTARGITILNIRLNIEHEYDIFASFISQNQK